MKLAVNGVDKSFGKNIAVQQIDLTITEGTIHGLLGSNGAGKTTLMKVLSGIYKADSGTVSYDGNSIYENPDVKNNVIFMHDIPFFFKGATLKKWHHFIKRCM
ncbi:ATP-binding cassette domain-containing protein [Jeotgalicoccus sp. WY2]|uniref:ATP-binding cassette domain-containing protein n=1 Tax=Jeotgalicoccus sp. WY2 TaxID=2708346 RepID=UPI003530054E